MPEPGVVGLYDPSDHTIYISLKQASTEIFATFIHELLHACQEIYGIDISHQAIYQYELALVELLLANF